MASRLRSTSALTAGSIGTGMLAYLFFALTTRALGPTDAAPVSVLWTWWGLTGAAVTFPIQHWVAQGAAANGGEAHVRAALPRVAGTVVLLALAVTGIAWVLRDPLFGDERGAFALLVGAVTVGAAVLGLARGVLTARRQFVAVAAGLVAENAVRCVLAAALMAAGSTDPVAYGGALVAGYTAILVWPAALRPRREGRRTAAGSPLSFLGGTAGGQVVSQAVLTGGPLVLALGGAAAHEVTVLFAGLALFRAPYLVALGQATQLTGVLTGLVVRRRDVALRRIRLVLSAGVALAAVAAAVVGALLGPSLLPWVFGEGVRLGATACALLAAGCTVALGTLAATVLVIATGRTGALVLGWCVAVLPGAACLVLASDTSLLLRTCIAFVVVEVVALAWFLMASRRRAPTAPVGTPP